MLTQNDPPTGAATIIYRTRTPTNLLFAIRFCFKHFCFTSHLHQLTTSRGINFTYFTLPFSFLHGFKSRAHTPEECQQWQLFSHFPCLDETLYFAINVHVLTQIGPSERKEINIDHKSSTMTCHYFWYHYFRLKMWGHRNKLFQQHRSYCLQP